MKEELESLGDKFDPLKEKLGALEEKFEPWDGKVELSGNRSGFQGLFLASKDPEMVFLTGNPVFNLEI